MVHVTSGISMAEHSTAQALPDINVHPTSSAYVKNGDSLETPSSCNIAREATAESINQAVLEAYWLGLNLVVTIRRTLAIYPNISLEIILEGVKLKIS